MLSNLFYLILLLIAIPTGLILKKLCKDEIKNWAGRFKLICLVSFILSLIFLYSNFEYKIPVIFSLFFIMITMIVLVWNYVK